MGPQSHRLNELSRPLNGTRPGVDKHLESERLRGTCNNSKAKSNRLQVERKSELVSE